MSGSCASNRQCLLALIFYVKKELFVQLLDFSLSGFEKTSRFFIVKVRFWINAFIL